MSFSLRYIGVPFAGSEIPGLCICGDTQTEAEDFISMVVAYFEQPGLRENMLVGFETYPDGKCNFLVNFGKGVGSVLIRYVDPNIVERMESGLLNFRNYIMLAGYGRDDFNLISPKEFNMFRSELVVDQRVLYGGDKIVVDWTEVSDLLKSE